MEKYLLQIGSSQFNWRAQDTREYFSTSVFVSANVQTVFDYFLNYVPQISPNTKSSIESFSQLYDELLKSEFVLGNMMYLPHELKSEGRSTNYLDSFNPYSISLKSYAWLHNQFEKLGLLCTLVQSNIYKDFNLPLTKKGSYPNFQKRRHLQQHLYQFVNLQNSAVLDVQKKNEVDEFKSVKLSSLEATGLAAIKSKYNLKEYSPIYGHQMGLVSSEDLALTLLEEFNPFSLRISCDATTDKYLISLGIKEATLSFKNLTPNLIEETHISNAPLNGKANNYWVLAQRYEPSLMGYHYVRMNSSNKASLVEAIESATFYPSLKAAQGGAALINESLPSYCDKDFFIAQYSFNFTAIEPAPIGTNKLYSQELSKIEKSTLSSSIDSATNPVSINASTNIKNKI